MNFTALKFIENCVILDTNKIVWTTLNVTHIFSLLNFVPKNQVASPVRIWLISSGATENRENYLSYYLLAVIKLIFFIDIITWLYIRRYFVLALAKFYMETLFLAQNIKVVRYG